MMPSKAPPIASVNTNDPATNATPRTIAKALSANRSFRAKRLRQVSFSTVDLPRPPSTSRACRSARFPSSDPLHRGRGIGWQVRRGLTRSARRCQGETDASPSGLAEREEPKSMNRKLVGAAAAAAALIATTVLSSTTSAVAGPAPSEHAGTLDHHGHHGHHGQHSRDRLPGGYKHLVVIYEENHSFDNLYGSWGRVGRGYVDGLDNASAAKRTQV